MASYRSVRRLGASLLLGAIAFCCSVPSARAADDGHWTLFGPPVRENHSAFVDAGRRQLVLFGGSEISLQWGDVWTYSLDDGSWRRLETSGPAPRGAPQAIYDANSDRIVAIGGVTWDSLSVWTLPLSGPHVWTRGALGTAPTGRDHFCLIYDPRRDRAVLFGGGGCLPGDFFPPRCGGSSEAWLLDLAGTPTWTQVSTPSRHPGGREEAGWTYDPVHDRMIVHDGRAVGWHGYTTYYHDTWALSLATGLWDSIRVAESVPFASTRLAYDCARDRLLLFEDPYVTGPPNDLMAFALAFGDSVWQPLDVSGTPPSIPTGLAVASDSLGGTVYFHGGLTDGLWQLTTGPDPTWTTLHAVSPLPGRREGAAICFDAARERALMFGGESWINDTWALRLGGEDRWERVNQAQVPVSRNGGSMVDLYPFDRALLFGGGGYYPTGDLWAFNENGPPTWSHVQSSQAPSKRSWHSAVSPGGTGKMVLFGGFAEVFVYGVRHVYCMNDLWIYENGWREIHSGGARPLPRRRHSAVWDSGHDRMIVFGGDTTRSGSSDRPTNVYRDAWAFSLADTSWTLLSTTGPARTGPSAVYDPIRDRLVVFGGRDSSGDVSDEVWALTLSGAPAWTRLAPSGSGPVARMDAAGTYDPVGDRFVLFGGDIRGDDIAVSDTWSLDWGSTAAPAIGCDDAIRALPGSFMVARAWVTSRLGTRQAHQVKTHDHNHWFPDSALRIDLDAGATDTVRWVLQIPDSAQGIDTLSFRAIAPGVPVIGERSSLVLAVPSLVKSPRVGVLGERVRLEWDIDDDAAAAPTVYRRVGDGPWVAVAHPAASGGAVHYDDHDVLLGFHYEYRLGVTIDGHEIYRGEIGVTVPGQLVLELAGFRPNPSPGAPLISFTLTDGAPASLEVFDIAGRRVWRRDVGALGAGHHLVGLGEAPTTRPGLYFIRLARGGRTLVTRGCIMR